MGAGARSGRDMQGQPRPFQSGTSPTIVREVHCWVEDIELRLHPDPVDVDVETVADGYRLTVSARSLVKDLTLLIDRLDPAASIDQALVTLPAGDFTTLHVRTSIRGIEQDLMAGPVLRTANDLVHSRLATHTRNSR